MSKNSRVILKYRPGATEVPTESNFDYVECPFPNELSDGQVLVKNLYLSADPTLRFAMNESNVPSYLNQWKLNDVVYGITGLGSIIKSKSPQFEVGDIVESGKWPWQQYFVEDTANLHKVPVSRTGGKLTPWLGVLGLSGLTALFGIREKGNIKRGVHQTLVVSGAAGSCGSLAGQIARLDGCAKVIGICGSDDKCRHVVDDLKFNAAINYKSQNVSDELKRLCSNGIDIYFDNVGGPISRTVVEQMNNNGHIILCGQISEYNNGMTVPFPMPPEIAQLIKDKNITRDPFIVLDYANKFPEATKQLSEWLNDGKLILRESIEEGLENAAKGFLKMMRGDNIGKQLIHIADP